MSRHFDQTMYHSDFAFSLFWYTKKNYRWLFCDKDKQNDIFKTKYVMFYLFQNFLQHFSNIMFSPFICIGWRTNGVWMKLHIIK